MFLQNNYKLIEELKTKNDKPYWKYSILYNETPVASVLVRDRKGNLTILSLNVDPAHRGQGIAKILLQTIIDKFGDKDLYIRPRPYQDQPFDCEILKRFYEKFGFVVYDDENRMVRKSSNM